MRFYLVLLHRYIGLLTAIFLFIAGFTGAIISWDHELDAWINPHFYKTTASGTTNTDQALALANLIEKQHPDLRITFMPLTTETDHTLNFFVVPRINATTQQPYVLDYNQIAINPANGKIQGKRLWGDISLQRENLLPFLYKLHYSMHIPDVWGVETGVLIMGIIAIAWTLDCLVALWIAFPNWQQWRKSFAFRFRQGSYKLNFDLHRSGGVWIWIFLLVLATTSISMNLGNQVMRPLVSVFSDLSQSPFETITPQAINQPVEPVLTREQAVDIAITESRNLGLSQPAGGIFYAPEYGFYGVGFFAAGNDHGDVGLGNPWIYIDGSSGQLISASIPGTGTLGDIFMQAQFPLHSGRIIGILGRILMTFMGLMVAMLSLTGIIIWWRKRRSVLISKTRRLQNTSDITAS